MHLELPININTQETRVIRFSLVNGRPFVCLYDVDDGKGKSRDDETISGNGGECGQTKSERSRIEVKTWFKS